MKYFLFLLIFLIYSCQNKKLFLPKKVLNYSVQIKSDNLSEDATLVSTHNDELLFLVFQKTFNDSILLLENVYFEFDSINSVIVIPIKIKNTTFPISIVLLEIDSDKDLTMIHTDIKKNLLELTKAYQSFDLIKQIELLKDDDLLGIEVIKYKDMISSSKIIFQGINLFDFYKYEINITKN